VRRVDGFGLAQPSWLFYDIIFKRFLSVAEGTERLTIMTMPIIQTQNLTKEYQSLIKKPGILAGVKSLFRPKIKKIIAVKKISFKIKEGDFVGFLGPNGAGKTTTLKMLSGILKPTAGEMKVLGFNPWEKKNDFKKQFSLVMGQKNQLWWDLPVMETFILNQKIYDIEKEKFKQRLDELVELLDIKKVLKIQVRKLSLGERMKCELAGALLHDPKVLFLDEPTIGLDIASKKKIRSFLIKYNRQKKTTIMLTSHYMEDIEKLCKRIIVIKKKIVYDGSFRTLINKYGNNKKMTVEDIIERIYET
jgi:ABC-2 type transport system ATP-binding protein